MEFDPDTNSLGTVLPLGQEYWSGDQLPFKINTLASEIVEGARAANANIDDATHDGRKRQSFSSFPAMQHEKNWTQTITSILSACDGVADANRGALDSSRLTGEFNLGIVGGTTNDGIDSERYIYLPSGSIMRWTSRPSYYLDRFYHEVPYPTLVSSSSRRLEKDPGVAVVLQDGSRFRFPADEELTTGELRRRISQRTGVVPERMTLSIDGLTLPEGLLQRPLDGPVQVTTTQTGGGGRKPGSSRSKKKARRATTHRISIERLSYAETLEIMENRENKLEETTEQEVVDIMSDMVCEYTQQKARRAETKYREEMASKNVPLYGTLVPASKPAEGVRVMSLNINGLQMCKSVNPKAERLKYILPKYEVDILGLQETCVNWRQFKPSNTIASLLRRRTESIRSTHSFNRHETKNIGNVQRGGTATVATDMVSHYVKCSGSDHTDLGRWSYYLLEGEPGHKTRVVTAYSPCGSKSSGLSTNWKAQERYIKNNSIRTRDPEKMFQDDLCAALRTWRSQGERIILLMDANDNVYDGKFTRRLSEEGLDLKEAVHAETEG
ncbi:hypothetical protein THAOC_16352, partial [Thalassiosira oceanica]